MFMPVRILLWKAYIRSGIKLRLMSLLTRRNFQKRDTASLLFIVGIVNICRCSTFFIKIITTSQFYRRFNTDSPRFFTPAIHSRIVQFILDRKRFSENTSDDFAFGIERLLNEKTYAAAYPLHDVFYMPLIIVNVLLKKICHRVI